jgi:hypothetical protein
MRCSRKNSVKGSEKYEGAQRRRHYRIEYPITERPTLIDSKEDEYEVVDICEYGVKFFGKQGTSYLPFQTLKGKIKFHDDKCEDIVGKILRSDEGVVVVCLATPIPYKRIVKEQLYFRKKPEYP